MLYPRRGFCARGCDKNRASTAANGLTAAGDDSIIKSYESHLNMEIKLGFVSEDTGGGQDQTDTH
jgi:hypothetical protein